MRRSEQRIGSVFSGIGGLELGLERAGLGPVRWQVESDAFCREVLATHWPDADRFDDVTTVDASGLAPVGVICGGFPCQDISQAGKGEGINGARSGLWREFARIVRVVRPRWVVVENVPALAYRGMGLVLGDLAASGYDAQWDCIPAAAVGAPHRRDRLFVVAWRVPNAERDGVRQRAERGAGSARSTDPRDPFPLDFRAAMADPRGERLQGRSRCGVDGAQRDAQPGRGGEALADADGGRREGQRRPEQDSGEDGADAHGHLAHGRDLPQWPPASDDMHTWGGVQADAQPALCRMADGVSDLMDRRRARLRALGNAVVPQVAEVIGRAIVTAAEETRYAE